jgi:hypothetical protein
MRRTQVLVFILAGCGADDMAPPTGPGGCPIETASILSPMQGATDVPRMFVTEVLWSHPAILHWTTLADDTREYDPVSEEVMPDGTIISHWATKGANTTYTLEVGWWCVSSEENCEPLGFPLDAVSFTTGAN